MHSELKRIPFSGDSMKPLLSSGDELIFIEQESPIQRGSIVVFKDPVSGEFVSHRVFKVSPLETKGDWACHKELVPEENIFGRAVGFNRAGRDYFFTTSPGLLSFYLFLSGQLLSKNTFLRKLVRSLQVILRPLLITNNLKESDL